MRAKKIMGPSGTYATVGAIAAADDVVAKHKDWSSWLASGSYEAAVGFLAFRIDERTHLPELIAALAEADKEFRLRGVPVMVHPQPMIRTLLSKVRGTP